MQAVKDLDIEVESRPLDEVVAQADILVTITSSFRALFDSSLVRLGTHICAMGTDTTGKQELDPSLFLRAKVYTDEPAQAQAIGECQHAIAQLLLSAEEIYPLGAVINGRAIGRTSDDDITVFDSTGVGLQDLAMAARVVEVARNQNRAICIDDNAVR